MQPPVPASQYLLRIQPIAKSYGSYFALTDEPHTGRENAKVWPRIREKIASAFLRSIA